VHVDPEAVAPLRGRNRVERPLADFTERVDPRDVDLTIVEQRVARLDECLLDDLAAHPIGLERQVESAVVIDVERTPIDRLAVATAPCPARGPFGSLWRRDMTLRNRRPDERRFIVRLSRTGLGVG